MFRNPIPERPGESAQCADNSAAYRPGLRRFRWAAVMFPAIVMLAGITADAPAQVLHVNDRWENCAMVIAPSLTQEAWREFVGEAGLVIYFRPLADAQPMGRGRVELAVLNWSTRIDDSRPAWNDTFSHPDSTHWLVDGAALPIPGLMVRAGLTDKVDAGLYVTRARSSNYGMIGGQIQYGFLDDRERKIAASGRATAVTLLGADDLALTVYGADLLVSREFGRFSPYAVVSTYLSRGHEHTSKVALGSEDVFGVQAAAGLVLRIGGIRLGAEYNMARVSGYSVKIGYGI
jgi:hypothetical protein